MSDIPVLTPVRPAHRFDERALETYLRSSLPGFPGNESLTVRQFEGGQSNPTFLLAAGGREYVLRKQPPGELLPSAHAVDREYRVMKALETTDVPVPRMHLLCDDPSVIGTKFYVMENLEGRVYASPLMPEASPGERATLYRHLADVLAALHRGLAGGGRARHLRPPRQLLRAPDLALEQAVRRVPHRGNP